MVHEVIKDEDQKAKTLVINFGNTSDILEGKMFEIKKDPDSQEIVGKARIVKIYTDVCLAELTEIYDEKNIRAGNMALEIKQVSENP
jgi:hypothetical protein